MKYQIVIFGSYSGKNKGDVAILQSIVTQLGKEIPNLLIHVLSKKPSNFVNVFPKDKYKHVTFHKSTTAYWGIHTLKILKSVDLLVLGGGGLFFDKNLFNIFYNHVINLFFLSLLNQLFFKKPVYIFSVGASHLESKLSILMTKYIINHAKIITVRDDLTYQLFSKLTSREIKLHYDPAFLLTARKNQSSNTLLSVIDNKRDHTLLLFILNDSLLNYYDKNHGYPGLVNIINTLQEQFFIVLTCNNLDCNNLNKLQDLCNNKNLSVFHPKHLTPEDIMGFYQNFDFAVCTPMHSAIFAYIAGVKLITISYNKKILELNKIIENNNDVAIRNLEKITDFIKNYNEIGWENKPTIIANVLENFNKLSQSIIHSKK